LGDGNVDIGVDALNQDCVTEAIGMFSDKCLSHMPSVAMAIGACAGFASQLAVWREVIMKHGVDAGRFLMCVGTKSGERLVFGEATNLFLFGTFADRLSFLSLAGAALTDMRDAPDVKEIASHVAKTAGHPAFGVPRVPPELPFKQAELLQTVMLPKVVLKLTWHDLWSVFERHSRRPGEWPALLGAAAYRVISSNAEKLAPGATLRIMVEAAIPMSKLYPTDVCGPEFKLPDVIQWTPKEVIDPAKQKFISDIIRTAMPSSLAVTDAVSGETK
jgi:hypothetical protein